MDSATLSISSTQSTQKSSMGVGTFYLMAAELAFILSNYGIHVWLARYLGPEAYGIFGVLSSLFLINQAFLNAGIPKAVSKFIAESKGAIKQIFRTSFRLQLTLDTALGIPALRKA